MVMLDRHMFVTQSNIISQICVIEDIQKFCFLQQVKFS